MPIRILIAEDNPAVRTALHTLLADAGLWEIVGVENGRDAIAKAQELRPNLIILDLVMPEMDGLRAAREISKLLPETPMLMYTMHWSPQVEMEAQKVGVRRVVSKADNRLLFSLVQQFLAEDVMVYAMLSHISTPVVSSADLDGLNADALGPYSLFLEHTKYENRQLDTLP